MESYPTYSEERLLQLIKADDYDAFEELYSRYFDLLYGYAYNVIRDKEVAKDIIQDIFTWFWENRQQWQLTSCKGYLLTAVRFKTASYFRSAKVQESFTQNLKNAPVLYPDESLELEVKELQQLIESLIQDLPDRCREIFQLSRFAYQSHKDIAKKLGISEKTVEAQITIALKKLRGSLGKYHYLLFLFL
ncbi:RNA polymerase sigma-70 factor [Sphingobacterium yanglingense]|uniref:RNA polymerase sigma-70 factor (ECF subfamily) n=1 Tax=Sphingobacterium yanglingense TaxID=1437280 RepID=A0A4R6WDV4_9SPHI|nr:RNA polymerase sigma-70 factor [Sphingobacterium yanglingense]TDQ77959.1 RNA polymerase sigma-70 factor (ECF subfamily) [Sphingobacterium yanglingense]